MSKKKNFSIVSIGVFVAFEDLKQSESINSNTVNNMLSEQCCTVTGIKRDWFNIRLKVKNHLSKAKRSMINMRHSHVTVTAILDRIIL